VLKPRWTIPVSFTGFIEAQQRVAEELGQQLSTCLRPDAETLKQCLVEDRLVLSVDGSRFECPRTVANEEGLGCAGKERSAPQIFHTHLQHVGTGLPWDFRLGPGTDSERRHLDEMLKDLPAEALLTADAGFISYELCATLTASGHEFVLRVGANKTLIEDLEPEYADDPSLVWLWPEQLQSKPPLRLRRIEFSSPAGTPVVLVTNILDRTKLSDQAAQNIYASRWGIEVYFRDIKQTMDFAELQSRTRATCLNEQYWRVLSCWMLQGIFKRIQLRKQYTPRRFSAAKARREIREVLELLQQDRRGPSIEQRAGRCQVDNYERNGPKATRKWPRKKNDKPPKPPKLRPAKPQEILRAKELGVILLKI
jgi:hypothetical protein